MASPRTRAGAFLGCFRGSRRPAALWNSAVVRYVFDGFRLEPELFELVDGAAPVALEPQAFDVLVHLLRQRDRVVSKEELMDSVWGGRFVSETAVTSRIKQVRSPALRVRWG